jgi:hypothetical protein
MEPKESHFCAPSEGRAESEPEGEGRSKLTVADDGGLEGDDRAAAREGGRDLRRHRDRHAGTGTGGGRNRRVVRRASRPSWLGYCVQASIQSTPPTARVNSLGRITKLGLFFSFLFSFQRWAGAELRVPVGVS